MAEGIPSPSEKNGSVPQGGAGKQEFRERVEEASELFSGRRLSSVAAEHRDRFLSLFSGHRKGMDGKYVDVIKSLPPDVSRQGTLWLNEIVLEAGRRIGAFFPGLGLFKKKVL
jgi:hypothetical protein